MNIQLLNKSTVLSDSDLQDIAEALNLQLSGEFADIWHLTANVIPTSEDNGMTPIYLVDTDADAPPGALAWHTVDDKFRPYGIVPLKPLIADGSPLCPTIGHEVLELVVDPYCLALMIGEWPAGSGNLAFVSAEICDPVENSMYSVTLASCKKISCTNFVTPAWFAMGTKEPWDHLGNLNGPLTLERGGYIQWFSPTAGWQQASDFPAMARMASAPHSRRERRKRKMTVKAA
jgi:hypothetical protein